MVWQTKCRVPYEQQIRVQRVTKDRGNEFYRARFKRKKENYISLQTVLSIFTRNSFDRDLDGLLQPSATWQLAGARGSHS